MKTLGQRIAVLRKKKKKTLEEIAKLLKCSRMYLCDMENGRRYGSEDLLKKLGKILGDKTLIDRCPTLVAKRLRHATPAKVLIVSLILKATPEQCRRISEILQEPSDEESN